MIFDFKNLLKTEVIMDGRIDKFLFFASKHFNSFWGKSYKGIYVIYGDKTYALNENIFFKYKEAGYITYQDQKRVLSLTFDLDIKSVHGSSSLIEITDKKD